MIGESIVSIAKVQNQQLLQCCLTSKTHEKLKYVSITLISKGV